MKTLGFVLAIVLACLAGTAQADVVSGNLVENGDFAIDLSGWTGGGAADVGMAWTGSAPDRGGMQINGEWESIYTTAYTFVAADIGKTFYVSFDAGSLDQTAAGNGLYLRLSQHTHWHDVLSGGCTLTAAQLNAGLASYQNNTFTVPSNVTVGDKLELWFDAYGAGVTGANHIVVDNVSITTSPIPEPGTLVLVVMGLFGLLAYAWRRHK